MFSLIIVLLSIALVVLLVLATLYFGGKSMSAGGVRAAAAAVISQSSQISGAGALAVASGKGWPAGAPLFPKELLSPMPVPPVAAYAPGLAPSVSDWEYFRSDSHSFGLRHKLSKKVCLEVNRQLGFYGIPMSLPQNPMHLCFGAKEPYSYFNAALDEPAPVRDTIVGETVTDANEELAANPVESVEEDTESPTPGGTIGSATPGYPVLCASGVFIGAGGCAGSNPGGVSGAPIPPPPPTPPQAKPNLVTAFPNVVQPNGSQLGMEEANSLTVCTNDAPPGTVNLGSSFFVNGVPLETKAAFMQFSAQCLGVSGTPAGSGVVPIRLVTSGGAHVFNGTIAYASTPSATPVVTSLSPNTGSAKAPTLVTINGSGFTKDSSVYAGKASLPVKFINANTLQTVIPVAESLALNSRFPQIHVMNPSSLQSEYQHFEYGVTPTITNLQPMVAAAGTTVSVIGQGLVAGTKLSILGEELVLSQDNWGMTTFVMPSIEGGWHPVAINLAGYEEILSAVDMGVVGPTTITPSPARAYSGELVTVKGVPLMDGVFVVLNGRQVPSTIVNGTTITFNAPAEGPGEYQVMIGFPRSAPVFLPTPLVLR